MKKIIFLVLIIFMLFVFSACVRNVSNDTSVSEFIAIITWGSNGVEKINVSNYDRVDQSLTRIISTDGAIYYVHPMNLLMIERRNSNGSTTEIR